MRQTDSRLEHIPSWNKRT